MGAGPWRTFYSVRDKLGRAAINFASNPFKVALYTHASNATDLARVVISELTGEVANGNGYVSGGKALANVQWIVAATPDEMRFTADPLLWTAAGGPIANVQYAVIYVASGVPATSYLICGAALEENGQFTVPSGDPLSVAPATGGILELQ